MSPVEQTRNHAGRAVLVAIVSIVILGVGLWLAAVALNRTPSSKLHLGDATFQGGNAKRLAAEIADRGPIFYSDVSGRRERDLILQHLGTSPKKGWYAFLAAPEDEARDCTWQWQPKERIFRAACDRSRTAPADGEGLPQFVVTVRDGRLDVDLNADARTTTTTARTGG